MKKDKDTRIVIIGMGFLMGYIYPCYENFITPVNLPEQLTAVTADENKIPELRRKYPFRIILNDNLKALRQLHPDIILFAPPPSVAPMLATTVLRQYYDEEREAGRELPDLYAFPPTPHGRYYLDLLGSDIQVCNILPNMVKEINGVKLNGAEGNSYITYPNESPWPLEKKDRLERFFAPLGSVVDVEPQNIMEVLSTLVATDVMPGTIFTITDALDSMGYKVSYKDITTILRNRLHNNHPALPPDNNSLIREDIDKKLIYILGKYCDAWYEGLSEYLVQYGIEDAKIHIIISRKLDIALHACQEEPREIIERNCHNHATPDGVLEKGHFIFDVLMKDRVFTVFNKFREILPDEDFYKWVENMALETCQIVTDKGKKLAGNADPVKFTPEMHALLFGLIVRNAVKYCGEEALDACEEGVKRYAMQRGNRMGMQAERNNDKRSFLNYMAYGEWKPEPGKMDIRETAFEPTAVTRVYKCPWHHTWGRLGFFDEGRIYCRHIDKFLVKGYQENLELGLNSIKMEGAEYCEFVWNGLNLNECNQDYLMKKRKELDNSCIRSWEYHTMHLFSTMSKILIDKLENGKQAVDRTIDDFIKVYDKNAGNTLMKSFDIDFNTI